MKSYYSVCLIAVVLFGCGSGSSMSAEDVKGFKPATAEEQAKAQELMQAKMDEVKRRMESSGKKLPGMK